VSRPCPSNRLAERALSDHQTGRLPNREASCRFMLWRRLADCPRSGRASFETVVGGIQADVRGPLPGPPEGVFAERIGPSIFPRRAAVAITDESSIFEM
jgi:hypothetical protein